MADSLGSGPNNFMQLCFERSIRMERNREKRRLDTFASSGSLQADTSFKTRRARHVVFLTAPTKTGKPHGFLRLSALSKTKSALAEWMK